ncbi:hypothetical protein D3C87_1723990 [compost metagenome]
MVPAPTTRAPTICNRDRDSFKKNENTKAKKIEEFLKLIANPGAETFKPNKKIKKEAMAAMPVTVTRPFCNFQVCAILLNGAFPKFQSKNGSDTNIATQKSERG